MSASPAPSSTPPPAWQTRLTWVLAAAFSAYILAAYSSLTRPIWIDEYLHYALGSHRSTAEAWRSISETLPTFNHGQTGMLMLVNYWMLDVFGASAVVLRFPSYLAASFMLFSAVRIALRLRFNPAWTLLVLAAFFCQQNLMHYAGEARPYILLASAVVGTLAFYLVPVTERTAGTRIGGGIALWLGVLFHPFFAPYWLALALYTYWIQPKPESGDEGIVTKFIRHCDPWLSVPAAIACLLLAKLTWMRGAPDFGLDPLQWIRGDGLFRTFVRIAHFQFLGKAYLAPFIALAVGVGAVAIPAVRRSDAFRRLLPPLALLVIALVLSVALSALTYQREYWVLPRQWVASMALCCVATIWLAREIARVLSGFVRFLDLPVLAFIAWVLYGSVTAFHQMKSADLQAAWSAILNPQSRVEQPSPEIDRVPANNEEWVALANQNIAAGGKVWPIFRRFYARND